MNIDYDFGTLEEYYKDVDSLSDAIATSNEFLTVNSISLGYLINFINSKPPEITGTGLSQYLKM